MATQELGIGKLAKQPQPAITKAIMGYERIQAKIANRKQQVIDTTDQPVTYVNAGDSFFYSLGQDRQPQSAMADYIVEAANMFSNQEWTSLRVATPGATSEEILKQVQTVEPAFFEGRKVAATVGSQGNDWLKLLRFGDLERFKSLDKKLLQKATVHLGKLVIDVLHDYKENMYQALATLAEFHNDSKRDNQPGLSGIVVTFPHYAGDVPSVPIEPDDQGPIDILRFEEYNHARHAAILLSLASTRAVSRAIRDVKADYQPDFPIIPHPTTALTVFCEEDEHLTDEGIRHMAVQTTEAVLIKDKKGLTSPLSRYVEHVVFSV